jgi:hypothetical protein
MVELKTGFLERRGVYLFKPAPKQLLAIPMAKSQFFWSLGTFFHLF